MIHQGAERPVLHSDLFPSLCQELERDHCSTDCHSLERKKEIERALHENAMVDLKVIPAQKDTPLVLMFTHQVLLIRACSCLWI